MDDIDKIVFAIESLKSRSLTKTRKPYLFASDISGLNKVAGTKYHVLINAFRSANNDLYILTNEVQITVIDRTYNIIMYAAYDYSFDKFRVRRMDK